MLEWKRFGERDTGSWFRIYKCCSLEVQYSICSAVQTCEKWVVWKKVKTI